MFVFMKLDELILKSKGRSGPERVNSAGPGCLDPAHSRERLLLGKCTQSPWNTLPDASVFVRLRPWAMLSYFLHDKFILRFMAGACFCS